MSQQNTDISHLLRGVVEGREGASDELFSVVYEELRRIARDSRFVGAHGDTMQATVLANEAYLTLARRFALSNDREIPDLEAFYRSVALAMRTILRDYWRSKTAAKRGGPRQPAPLLGDVTPQQEGAFSVVDYLALDEALGELESFNPRWFAVVMHRHFAGRSVEDTASMLNIGVTTVKSDWQLARAWLRRKMRADPD